MGMDASASPSGRKSVQYGSGRGGSPAASVNMNTVVITGRGSADSTDFFEMTPMDALNCQWLRLTAEQVARLEQMVRDMGMEPGIHAHSDVTQMDVFEELRDIRAKEKTAKENYEREARERKSKKKGSIVSTPANASRRHSNSSKSSRDSDRRESIESLKRIEMLKKDIEDVKALKS